jgi:thiol-disulfide isomerase/thioredoxin
MKQYILIICLYPLIAAYTGQAQPLSGTLEGFPGGSIYLLQYHAGIFAYEVIDSATTDALGQFRLVQPSVPGMYRICQGRAGWYSSNPGNTLHLWLGYGEAVEFSAVAAHLTDRVKFTRSLHNQRWYGDQRQLAPLQQRLSICMQLLDNYGDSSGVFYSQTRQEYLRVQQRYRRMLQDLNAQEPGSWATGLQEHLAVPFTGNRYRHNARMAWWQEHWLDSVDFSDSRLQASHLAADKLEQYLQLFGWPYSFATTAAADSSLLPVVKGILEHCRKYRYGASDLDARTVAMQFVFAWLYRFLNEKGLNNCLDYTAGLLTTDLLSTGCHAPAGIPELLQRMQASRKLRVGMGAPEITLNSREAAGLADIKASVTLVVFWASWCPHCQESLPELKKIYDSTGRSRLEILAISIDTSLQAWGSAIAQNGYGWMNYCDFKGWDSRPVQDYGVYATPEMFLLDSHKQLIARLTGMADLRQWLARYFY